MNGRSANQSSNQMLLAQESVGNLRKILLEAREPEILEYLSRDLEPTTR